MAKPIEQMAVNEGFRMFASVSPDNYASLNSVKAVSDVRIIKTLENGYYYIECSSNQDNTNQRRVKHIDNQVIVILPSITFNLSKEVKYAA